MLFADKALARRIEAAEAAVARGFAQPDVESLDAAGGCALFQGPDSPLTQAVGMGLAGAVTEPEVETVERFFLSRGATPKFDVCPLADPGLIAALGNRGYRVAEFNNVLARPVAGTAPLPPAENVRRAMPEERELWSLVVGRGFFEEPRLSEAEMDIGRAIFRMKGVACYIAIESGEPAGGAAWAPTAGVAALFSDSVLVSHRRRGLHRELIAARLRDALAHGCDLATASTLPDSASQRNYQRSGFEVVYTRVTFIRPFNL
jgi:GNAT superfamily N-acetyltransferase